MSRRAGPILLGLAAVVLGACAGDPAARVEMTQEKRFEPTVLEVPIGTTVTWENDGVFPHVVVAVDREREATTAFASDTVVGTGRFSHTFDQPGAFTYVCRIHEEEDMVGLVVVSS